MACLLHKWNGCKCGKCGKTRDSEHEFVSLSNQCKEQCKKCEKTRDTEHSYDIIPNQCQERCKTCGSTRQSENNHLWVYDKSEFETEEIGKEGKTCSRCSARGKVFMDDNMALGFINDIYERYGVSKEFDAVPILGKVTMFNIMFASFSLTEGYMFLPFESVWNSTYTQDDIDRYIAEKASAVTGIDPRQLTYQLQTLANLKTGLESFTDTIYLAFIAYLAPEDQRDSLSDEAVSLTKEQKILKGKDIFRRRYERL